MGACPVDLAMVNGKAAIRRAAEKNIVERWISGWSGGAVEAVRCG